MKVEVQFVTLGRPLDSHKWDESNSSTISVPGVGDIITHQNIDFQVQRRETIVQDEDVLIQIVLGPVESNIAECSN